MQRALPLCAFHLARGEHLAFPNMQGSKSGDIAVPGRRDKGQVLPGWWQQQRLRLGLRTPTFSCGLGRGVGDGALPAARWGMGTAYQCSATSAVVPGLSHITCLDQDKGTGPGLIFGAITASDKPKPPVGLPKSSAKDMLAALCCQCSPGFHTSSLSCCQLLPRPTGLLQQSWTRQLLPGVSNQITAKATGADER